MIKIIMIMVHKNNCTNIKCIDWPYIDIVLRSHGLLYVICCLNAFINAINYLERNIVHLSHIYISFINSIYAITFNSAWEKLKYFNILRYKGTSMADANDMIKHKTIYFGHRHAFWYSNNFSTGYIHSVYYTFCFILLV